MRMQPRREAAPCVTSALTPRLTSSPRPAFARGGKHCLLRWTGPRGEAQVFAVPGTPGDWRSVENTRHELAATPVAVSYAGKIDVNPGNGPHLSPSPFSRARPIRIMFLEEVG